ncbi:MAG TPA: diacylglycerol kinase family protein [Kofleriaceae bacterium]|nr:diacylglycerol kinase family protein [Kofleriaceae bacterium]
MRAVALVNRNARRARSGAADRLARAAPGQVRLTGSLDEARAVIRDEVGRGVDLVVFAGGDGTVVMGLAMLAEACRGHARPEPAVGVLRLGAGNAIADAVGATSDPAADLARLVRGDGAWRAAPMIDVLGVRAPFVGVGVDAQLLEDQRAVGDVIDRVPGGRFVGGAARYALSVALRSVPRFARGDRPHAVVRNAGAPAIEMARTGPTGAHHAAGAVLWQGACTLIAGATIPYFGFGLKMFPFADARPDRFHLRCGDAGLLEIVRNTPAAFRGTYFSRHVRDFLCDRVVIELDRASPVEAGGELLGTHPRIDLGLAAPVTFAMLGAR